MAKQMWTATGRRKRSVAQVRMTAIIDTIGEVKPDPDNGKTYERLLTTPSRVIELLGWGEVGKLQVGAIVVVNAIGDVYEMDSNKPLAGLLNKDKATQDKLLNIWETVIYDYSNLDGITTIVSDKNKEKIERKNFVTQKLMKIQITQVFERDIYSTFK